MVLNGELSALVHSSRREDVLRPLEEAREQGGMRGFLQQRDGPFQPEPFGPRSEKKE